VAKAIIDFASETVEHLAMQNKGEEKPMVLRKQGVNKRVSLSSSVNHGHGVDCGRASF
jgi:hypothetical protein